MNLVVDASVALKWFVRENLHKEAMRLLDHIEPLQAPDLIVAEVTNIAWKKCIRRESTRSQAEAIATAIRQYVPVLHSSTELNERALEIALALNHPVYDCLYIACAEKTDAILITADERLCKATEETDFGELVRHLGYPNFLDQSESASLPLQIHLDKIEQIIQASERFQQTSNNIHDQLTAGKEFGFVNTGDLRPMFDSPVYLTLRSLIENLSENEQADILALGWLGQGYSGTNWQPIRDRAEAQLKIHNERYIDYLCGITCDLGKGLAILQNWT